MLPLSDSWVRFLCVYLYFWRPANIICCLSGLYYLRVALLLSAALDGVYFVLEYDIRW